MKWKRGYKSRHVRDVRGAAPGVGGLPLGLAGGGVTGVLILLAFLFLGGSGLELPEIGLPQAPGLGNGEAPPTGPDPEADLVSFVSFVLDDTQATWSELFQRSGKTYRPAELVLFRDATNSGCGYATSQVGPFYCGADETIYLDLGFFRELRNQFGAAGDFAQAYVVAHEVGHHVQNQLGVSSEVQRAAGENPDEANELSIAQELQADCFAGVWGQTAYDRELLEQGDLAEGLNAASAIGDDRIQEQTTGRINPENWTHGSSDQRRQWFEAGYNSGDADSCDTFSALL
jgi:predicted metalloprotease